MFESPAMKQLSSFTAARQIKDVMVGIVDIRMTAPAGASADGTKEDKNVPLESCLAAVTMPLNSCSHLKPIFT